MANENIAVVMKKLRTQDLKDGMRFTSTVFIDKKNIVVGPNAPIKQKDIERLLKWGINELETSGELIVESTKTAEDEHNNDQDGDILASAIKSELEKLGPPQAEAKRRLAPRKGGYEPRDCSIPRQLKSYYQSWLDDIDKLYQMAVDDYAIDKGDSLRIAGEIIEKVQTEKDALVSFMRKGKKRTYLAVHGVNVAIYAAMVGIRLEMRTQDLLHFVLGCLFIDIGMVKIPISFFAKESKPNPEERRTIRAHPVHGYKILVQLNDFPKETGLVALEHHERVNGSGYPRELNATQISTFGRIAAILDTYEAMTSQRSYREEYISHEAMRAVVALGQANFDKQYLAIFLREIGVYPVGTYVRLNNNAIALVVAAAPSAPMRPEIKILLDEFGDPVNHTEIIHLLQTPDLTIIKALNEKEKQDIL